LRALGLETLAITPLYNISKNERIFSVRISHFTDDQRTKLIKQLYGNYAFKTDLVEVKDIFTLHELQEIQETIIDEPAAPYRTTLHPYIVAMGMNPENRPLAILAIKKAEENERIIYLKGRTENASISYALSKMTPSTQDYLNVAEQYSIKEIMPCINDFKAICNEYINVWVN